MGTVTNNHDIVATGFLLDCGRLDPEVDRRVRCGLTNHEWASTAAVYGWGFDDAHLYEELDAVGICARGGGHLRGCVPRGTVTVFGGSKRSHASARRALRPTDA